MAWGKGDAETEIDRALRRSLRAAVAGDWPTAETWLERIVEANSKDLDAYHALARLYRQQGSIGRAIRMHQNLLLRSDVPKTDRNEAMLELARDFDEGGFRDRAISAYEEVLASSPRNAYALERLAALLHESGDTPRTLAVLKKLRRRDKAKADAIEVQVHLKHAQSSAASGNDDDARSALKKCVKRDAGCGEAWAMLGELEAERGKASRALDAWKKAAGCSPEIAAAVYPKIDASFAAKNKPDGFIAYLRDVLKEDQTRHLARITLARALASKGETREGVEELARAIEVMPEATDLHAELGRQLLASGQEGEALKAYAQLVKVLGSPAELLSVGTAGTDETAEDSRAEEAPK